MLQFTFPLLSHICSASLILSSPPLMSPCHLITLSPYHLVTLSPCHLVTSSPCHLVTLPPLHLITSTSRHSPPRHPIDLSLYCPRLRHVLASSSSLPRPCLVLVLALSSSSSRPCLVLISSPILCPCSLDPYLDSLVSFVLFPSSPS